ncbi:hypothetical protein [Methyloversatilis sp.]|uniref:hypothetical protein n=1 Tax=Methyloversatilis sp. TaxID=2569862 RepID=UPI0027BB093C|nr:hypothetical protein [Methyloversatilis sp.]
MLRLILAVSLLVHVTGAVAAPDDLLRLSPPSTWGDWKLEGSNSNGNITLTNRGPASPQFSQWKESIVTFTFFPIGSTETTISALRQVAMLENSVCDGMNVVQPKVKEDRGFAVAYLQTFCRKHRGIGQGRLGFFKAISGGDRIYVVGVMKVAPTEAFGAAPGMFVGNDVGWIMNWQESTGTYLAAKVFACPDASSPREACSE